MTCALFLIKNMVLPYFSVLNSCVPALHYVFQYKIKLFWNFHLAANSYKGFSVSKMLKLTSNLAVILYFFMRKGIHIARFFNIIVSYYCNDVLFLYCTNLILLFNVQNYVLMVK